MLILLVTAALGLALDASATAPTGGFAAPP